MLLHGSISGNVYSNGPCTSPPSLFSRTKCIIRLTTSCSRAGGGISVTPSATQLSTEDMAAATAEFAHSTGLTDSEGEGEGDEDEDGTS